MENQKIEANNGGRQPALSPATCSATPCDYKTFIEDCDDNVQRLEVWRGETMCVIQNLCHRCREIYKDSGYILKSPNV